MNEWNEQMVILQQHGYSEKKLNAEKESSEIKDTSFLKCQDPEAIEEIVIFSQQHFVEVCYAQITSL